MAILEKADRLTQVLSQPVKLWRLCFLVTNTGTTKSEDIKKFGKVTRRQSMCGERLD